MHSYDQAALQKWTELNRKATAEYCTHSRNSGVARRVAQQQVILNNPELFVQVSHMDGTDEDDIRQSLVNAGIRMEAANRLVGTPTSSVQQAHENRHERLMNQFRDKFREIKNLNPKLRPAEITALVNQELPGIEQQLQKAGALVR